MNTRVNLLFGGLSLLALQGCKAPQVEQAGHPNIIYAVSYTHLTLPTIA